MSTDRPLIGIALMLLFCILAPLADAMAKIIGAQVALLTLVTLRFATQSAILLPMTLFSGRRLRLPGPVLRLSALRTLLHIAGIALMFLALRALPLAEAIAIAYVMPFLLLLLGWLFQGETVGHRRVAACVLGFAGTLMVVQPTFAEVGSAAFLPLGVAVIFAAFMLVTRRLSQRADPIELQAANGWIALAVLVPGLGGWAAWTGSMPFPEASDTRLWGSIAAMGLLGTASHLVITWALRFAPSATLAPVQYMEIPMAACVGWLIFGDIPDGLALAGILVTLAAGLYIVLRERRLSQRPEGPTPPRPAHRAQQ